MNRSRRTPVRQAALAFGVALLVYLATTGGSLATTDAVITYEVTRNLLRDGSVALTDGRMTEAAMLGPDGRYYSPFGLGQSLFNIPFFLAGEAVARGAGLEFGTPDTIAKAAVATGSAFAAAACVGITYLLAFRLAGRTLAAANAALALAFGSALWPYSKFGFNAPLTALCLAGGALGALNGAAVARVGPLLWGGAFLGFALLTRHELALASAVIVAWTAWCAPSGQRARAVAAIAAGPVTALLIWLMYNHSRFGNPLYAGHEPGFGTSGFAGLLTSPGGSIFLYSPVALAGAAALARLFRYDRRPAVLLAATAVVLFAFYGALDDWLGTRSYGPRYLVPLLPLLVAPIAPALASRSRTWARVLGAAVIAGVLVQLPGVMVDPGKVNVALGRPGRVSVEDRRYDWSLSALSLNAAATRRLMGPNVRYVAGREPRPPVSPTAGAASSFSDRLTFSLDFWWLYLLYLGVIPTAVALAIPLTLLACAWVLARRLERT